VDGDVQSETSLRQADSGLFLVGVDDWWVLSLPRVNKVVQSSEFFDVASSSSEEVASVTIAGFKYLVTKAFSL
jgi:hypothetical protein